MQRIDYIVRAEAKKEHPVVDTVSLTWEEWQKSRQKLQTAHGQEIALALPTGTRLHAGDLLAIAEGWIEVRLAPEDVLFIKPCSLWEASFVAYQIGNRHLPLEIVEDGLQTLYEPVLAAYFSQQAILIERAQRPFTPVSATSGHTEAALHAAH
jgi:urease accessory protein